ncbi:MAG TPA: SDR family oxidoreductase [Parafilimonas sp.]
MNLIVFGATGNSGKQIVQQALDAGHIVTAIARNPVDITVSHKHLTIIKADVLKLQTFINAMQNQDAVLSALGSRDRKPTVMFSEGMQNIITAMNKYSVKRIVCISASAIETSPKLNFFVRMATKILQRILKNSYRDMMRMEQLLKQSNLNWTIVRPPRLTNGALTNNYRFAVNEWLQNCTSISRADLAHFMLQHVSDTKTYQSIIEVAY